MPGFPGSDARRLDMAVLALLATVLLGIFLAPTVIRGYRFGVGPDVPVYLWWTRVGASRGLSLVGDRPAIAATIAAVSGTLRLPLVAGVAGMQYALAAGVGIVAAVLVRGRADGGIIGWATAGLLTGAFAVHLGGGYIANLAFTVPFLAAGVALATRGGRGRNAAAVLLGAAGLAHPPFFLVGIVVLTVTAAWAWIRDRDLGWGSDASRIGVAIVGGATIVAVGLWSMALGPDKLSADTSKDALLRRAGLLEQLRDIYRSRFTGKVHRYAPWLTLPLAALGQNRPRGFARRFLASWTVVTLVAIPVGAVTGWFPPDRVVTFAFSVPALAGLAIAWIGVWLRRRIGPLLAVAAMLMMVAIIGLAAIGSWREQGPLISPEEIEAATTAGRVAATTPEGTPLVFVVDERGSTSVFQAIKNANVIRAAVPPDRVDDVYIFLGELDDLLAGRATVRGKEPYDTMSALSLEEIPPGGSAVFVVREFDRSGRSAEDPRLTTWDDAVATTVPDARPLEPGSGELTAASPALIVGATVATAVLLWVVGFGWARLVLPDLVTAMGAALGFGVAALALSALVTERLGVPLDGWWGPALTAVLAGGLGYGSLILKSEPAPIAPA